MTAAQLIAALQQFPPEAPVMVHTSGAGFHLATGPRPQRVVPKNMPPGTWWPTSYVGGGSIPAILIE